MREEDFVKYYDMYERIVYRVSLHYTKDTYAAEDITQKVFCELLSRFDTINPDCVKAYLTRAARNMSLNYLRDRQREVHGEYLDIVGDKDAIYHSAEEEYIRNEIQHDKEEFVGSLLEQLRNENESWYQIIYMIFCLDMPHEVVARELDMGRDVLYSKLYRAKKWLRKKYEKDFDDL